MKTFLRVTAWAMLALGLLLVVGIGIAAVQLGDLVMSPGLSITVDGETVHLAGFSGEVWLLAMGGVLLAVVVVAVVLPLALLFGIGLPLLLCAGVLALVLLVAGTALAALVSPLIVLGLLVAWALRARRPRPAQPVQPDLPSRA